MFHHPSLGISIDISLVRLDIMKKQPLNSSVVDIDIDKVLSSFCEYEKSLNNPNYNDPHHWDISLYLTGTDLYKAIPIIEKFFNDYTAGGNAYVNGVCEPNYACAIAEIHAASDVISSIFKSSTSVAHNIGHL
jgi:hypothetical protein